MLISKNWLNKHIDLSQITNQQIIDALNHLGLEFEELIDYSKNQNVTVGRISVINKVEKSNKLSFCLVDIGEELVSPIMCGGNNLHEEQYVLVAKPGATLFNGTKIVERKLMGKISQGMICSLYELGIDEQFLDSKEIEGIAELKEGIDTSYEQLGSSSILSALNLDDVFFRVDLTLNRSDCLAEFVIAKELANYFNLKCRDLELFELNKFSKKIKSPPIIVESKAINAVKYLTSKIEPKTYATFRDAVWLKQNLQKANQEDWLVNNANIAAVETGQPLIVLDLNKIQSKLVISDNFENKENKIKKGDLVILDGKNFVHLIGGKTNTAYLPKNDTSAILVIALNVETKVMREQAKKIDNYDINLRRYIKPLSQSALELGILRFLHLINNENNIKDVSSINSIEKKKKFNKAITTTLEYFNNFLGTELKSLKILSLLTPLGFKVSDNKNTFVITPPDYRTDIHDKSDLAEEISRLYGYDNIQSKPVILESMGGDIRNFNFELINKISNVCIGQGFNKIKTYNLTSDTKANNFNFLKHKKLIKVMNPLSSNREVLRPTLMSNMFDSLMFNNSRNFHDQKYFTIEKIYHKDDFYGSYHLCCMAQEKIINNQWTHQEYKNSFFYMKGLLHNILNQLNFDVSKLKYKNISDKGDILNSYQSAEIILNNKTIGIIGVTHPKFEKELKIKKTYLFEINLLPFFDNFEKHQTSYKSFIINVPIKRDITIIQSDQNNLETIKNLIQKSSSLIQSIELIDHYKSAEKKTLTLTLKFNSIKQLNDLDIKKEFDSILSKLKDNNFKIL
ncbi:phenylalanine--tRNA ligase subunit beta [Spiroplasma endosymbiont of Amphibalanus improvisus]|uniref:phenylalanine--tRNA ligase subunit beta n=1 Tax=Spiroplasma endosymbiont of Amphibalanus improvisus TaxID=3066327 RepID=UPI00313D6695